VFAFIFLVPCILVAFDCTPTNIALLFLPGIVACNKNSLNKGKPYSMLQSKEAETKHPKLDPNYVTGFSDGESSFVINVYERKANKIGWSVMGSFSIELHERDADLLHHLQSY
jgi:hypothetical protein